MGQKIIISEQDRNEIRQMYNLPSKKDYVFDFILTENEKYLIVMDQVFVAGGDGKSIGSIWENTYIFNEILIESLSNQNIITESNKSDIVNKINNLIWNKEIINECLKDKNIITENWWDDVKSGVSDLGKKIGNTALNTVIGIWNQGVLPFLRWVRRSLYTGVGIVVDVVVSILAAKTNAIVWILVSLLDIYEIATNNFDPEDDARRSMPYILLLADLMGVVFSGGVALLFKKGAQTIAKEGIKDASPTIVKYLKLIGNKIPSLKSTLKSGANLLSKKMGKNSTGIISKMLSVIDNILNKLGEFISKLFTKQGAKAVGKGGAVYGTTKILEKGLENTKLGNVIGQGAKNIEGVFQQNIKSTSLTDDEVNDVLTKLRASI